MLLNAKSDYLNQLELLKLKKKEYRQLKINNEIERKQLKREKREAERLSKLKPLVKKSEFLPYIRPPPFINEQVPIAVGTQFYDLEDRLKLIMPDKCVTNKPPVNRAGQIWTIQDPKL